MEKEIEGKGKDRGEWMSRSGWLSGLLQHLWNRLNQTWPGCNEGEGPGCATGWVNSDCFSPGFPNKGNNGTIVPPALIKRRTRDGVRRRSREGMWVKKGQEGRRGVERRGVGECRSEWEPDRNRGWGGRGRWRKTDGWREMARGAFLILIFFFSHFHCILFSHQLPPVSISFYLLSQHISSLSFPLILSSILLCFSILLATYSTSSICPLFLFVFAFGMVRDALPVIPPLHHLFLSSAGERETEKKGARKKKRTGRGEERNGWWGGGGEKRGRSKTKRKDHAASWLNEHGQRMITIEYIMLLLVEAINQQRAHHWHTIFPAWALAHSQPKRVTQGTPSPCRFFPPSMRSGHKRFDFNSQCEKGQR